MEASTGDLTADHAANKRPHSPPGLIAEAVALLGFLLSTFAVTFGSHQA
jgi:hypothetical protein